MKKMTELEELQAYRALGSFDHLRELVQAEKNEPLTLDELREMDGEPLWIVYNEYCPPHWRIWNNKEDYDPSVFKAYRRKPKEKKQ